MSYVAFVGLTEITLKPLSNPFLVLRLCHNLNAENQVHYELRISQDTNLSQNSLSSGVRIKPPLDLLLREMSTFIFTLFLPSD